MEISETKSIGYPAFSATACGKLSFFGKSDQDTSSAENTDGSGDTIPSADTSSSSDEDTSEDKNATTNRDGAVDDSWKAEFEKNLLLLFVYLSDLLVHP